MKKQKKSDTDENWNESTLKYGKNRDRIDPSYLAPSKSNTYNIA